MSSTQTAILTVFKDLFAGRTDAYGKEHEVVRGKVRYRSVKEPVTDAVLMAHLKGEYGVGIYPIVDGRVKWGAVDIDGPKNEETKEFLTDAWSKVWPEAIKQRDAFRRAGLHAYIERSRSGNGAHVWVFFDDWVDASAVRKLLYSLLTVEKKTAEVVYPVQVDPSGRDFGNLLALPFFGKAAVNGNSVFLDPDGTPIKIADFLTGVTRNLASIVPAVQEEVVYDQKRQRPTGVVAVGSDNYRPTTPLRGALKVISPYGCKFMHDSWVNRRTLSEPQWYVAIQQATAFHRGREFAHAISRDYPKYNPHEVDAKFDQAMRNPPAGCAYIREHFPDLMCANCPGRAPYHIAGRGLKDLIKSSAEDIEKVGSFQEDLKLVKAFDQGTAKSGIDWGVPLLSKHHRLRNSELVIVGGFPSLGKTWFMLDNAINMARKKVIVPIFSAETARKQLRQRLLSNAAQVDLSALRGERATKLTREEWKALERAGTELERLPIYTDFTSMSPEQVLEQVEELLLRDGHPLDSDYVLFFDYLQFGFREPGEETDTERIGRLAGEFKLVSKILDHPSVVFSQLRRDKEVNDEDEEVRPELNWLANSANIERTMDSCFFITGKRYPGLYAPRTLWKMKDRDGQAPMQDSFVLQQNCGLWKAPNLQNSQASEASDSLREDFNVG